jgi:5-methylcytosine-specific restriction enzyme subunit McrC
MPKTLITHEHQPLRYGSGEALTKSEWKALAAFHARGKNSRFYDLIHRGIKLKSYVGVLRVGGLTIEILPKLDRNDRPDHWRDRLLDLLHVVSELPSHHPSTAHLRTRPNDILQFYLTLLAEESERLLRGGLAKAYHPRRGNRTALRGRLLMSRHLTENLLHKERFYVVDTTYDHLHPLNQILRQALVLSRRLATTPHLQNRLAELELRFPPLPELHITDTLFSRIRYDRRTMAYRPAIEIGRLLLLNLHPDLRGGRHEVLALLFDMNRLWEGFLTKSLQRYLPPGYRVEGQRSDTYWASTQLNERMTLRPDLTIFRDQQPVAILDAKWKVFDGPLSSDLQQLFTYAGHFTVDRVALVYPHSGPSRYPSGMIGGVFREGANCDILLLPVSGAQRPHEWMQRVAAQVTHWLADEEDSRT